MITIANRLRPFSRRPGTRCLIPGTTTLVEAFPTLVRVGQRQFSLDASPLTVVQDLERGCVTLFGRKERYHVLPSGEIVQTKHPQTPPLKNERLCLGVHKKQEWEGVARRLDLREIFPFWFRLGSLAPSISPRLERGGMFALLDEIRQAPRPEALAPLFRRLFLAGFDGMLVPRLQDADYQGLVSDYAEGDPQHLLIEGAALIRSLFINAGEELHFLPSLPPECHCGRMTGIETPFGTIDLEWSKKLLRRVRLQATVDTCLPLRFQSALKSFRLNCKERHRAGEGLEIKSGALYLLDNFQK